MRPREEANKLDANLEGHKETRELLGQMDGWRRKRVGLFSRPTLAPKKSGQLADLLLCLAHLQVVASNRNKDLRKWRDRFAGEQPALTGRRPCFA